VLPLDTAQPWLVVDRKAFEFSIPKMDQGSQHTAGGMKHPSKFILHRLQINNSAASAKPSSIPLVVVSICSGNDYP